MRLQKSSKTTIIIIRESVLHEGFHGSEARFHILEPLSNNRNVRVGKPRETMVASAIEHDCVLG